MRARLYELDALPAPQIEAWDRLLAALPASSPFLSHAFCRAVQDVRGGVRVLHVETGGGEAGFLPFQIRTGRALLGHAEKVGGSLSDMFGVVGTVSRLDSQALLRAARLSSLRFDHAVEGLCPFEIYDRQDTCGVRTHIDDFAAFLGKMRQADQQFVGMVAAGERRLAKKCGRIAFSWRAADPPTELGRIVRVKREQYRNTGVPDGLAEAWKQKLLFRLLEGAASSPGPAIVSTLYAGDDWIASHLGLAHGDTFHIWFPTYNPEFGRFGPGHILFSKMLEHGAQQGFHWFDFGQGEAVYKSRYCGERYPLLKGVIGRPTIRGHMERILQSLQWRLQRRSARKSTIRTARETAAPVERARRDV